MSKTGSSDSLACLRKAIAAIEGLPPGELAAPRGQGRTDAVRLAGGDDEPPGALDAALGRGLDRDGLHEIVSAGPADLAAASGFALALAARFALARPGQACLWVVEDFSGLEGGAPYGPGLFAHGFDPRRLILVNAARPGDVLWVLEEALRARALCAVLGEVRSLKTYDLLASRRLLLAARGSAVPCLVLRADAAGQGACLSSAADTRFEVRASVSPRAPFGHGLPLPGLPLPGLPAWSVRLAKARARYGQVFDPDRFFDLVWDPAERCLRDDVRVPADRGVAARAPVSVDRPALSLDRSREAPSAGRGAAV